MRVTDGKQCTKSLDKSHTRVVMPKSWGLSLDGTSVGSLRIGTPIHVSPSHSPGSPLQDLSGCPAPHGGEKARPWGGLREWAQWRKARGQAHCCSTHALHWCPGGTPDAHTRTTTSTAVVRVRGWPHQELAFTFRKHFIFRLGSF